MGRARRGIPSETDASFGDTPSGPAALGTGVSSWGSCSRSVPIWSHCRDRVNIRRVMAVI